MKHCVADHVMTVRYALWYNNQILLDLHNNQLERLCLVEGCGLEISFLKDKNMIGEKKEMAMEGV